MYLRKINKHTYDHYFPPSSSRSGSGRARVSPNSSGNKVGPQPAQDPLLCKCPHSTPYTRSEWDNVDTSLHSGAHLWEGEGATQTWGESATSHGQWPRLGIDYFSLLCYKEKMLNIRMLYEDLLCWSIEIKDLMIQIYRAFPFLIFCSSNRTSELGSKALGSLAMLFAYTSCSDFIFLLSTHGFSLMLMIWSEMDASHPHSGHGQGPRDGDGPGDITEQSTSSTSPAGLLFTQKVHLSRSLTEHISNIVSEGGAMSRPSDLLGCAYRKQGGERRFVQWVNYVSHSPIVYITLKSICCNFSIIQLKTFWHFEWKDFC